MRNVIILSSLFHFFFVFTSIAQPTYVPQLEEYVNLQMSSNNIPGIAIGIVEKGEIIYCKGFGASNQEGGLLTEKSPFVLASLTKSFTGMAISQLARQGKLKYSDKVISHLPSFGLKNSPYANEITIDHLLHHTSGIPGISSYKTNRRGLSLQAKVARLNEIEGNQKFNQFQYANDNYAILGLIIEKISHLSFEDYVQQRILNPLNLSNTYFSQEAAADQNPAVGHHQYFGLPFESDINYFRTNLPNGGMLSSASDMCQYLVHYLTNYNGEEPYDLFTYSDNGYRKGWFIENTDQGLKLYHGGSLADFRNFMVLYPDKQQALVVLINMNSVFLHKQIDRIPDEILNIINKGDAGAKASMRLNLIYWVFIWFAFLVLIFMVIVLVKHYKSTKISELSDVEINKRLKQTWINNFIVPILLITWLWYLGNHFMIAIHNAQPDILLFMQMFFLISIAFGIITLMKIKSRKQNIRN